MFRFELIHRSGKSRARVGRIHTPHGIIETPCFVPVGTNATLKAIDSKTVEQLGVQLMFCNTYHLLLHPGPDVVAAAGGLHGFMNRTMPIITDSGGFQVFSLAFGTVHDELKSRGKKKAEGTIIKVNEDGVLFRSYRDGQLILLTPESSVQIQKKLGADIIIPLDELPPYHISAYELKKSFERTHRWEKRSLVEHRAQVNGQAMYAVVHGGIDPVLRAESCKILSQEPFDGYAIGGSFGKNIDEMLGMLTALMPHMPDDKPNHLLGMGDPRSLEQIIPFGIDTFDSSYPTRCARHGLLFTKAGMVNMLRGMHKHSFIPVDDTCPCLLCTSYTRAYLHHLFKAQEITALMLATIHNLHYMVQRVAHMRELILRDEI
jgi:queuine tRNA-ribosyltransferase